MSKKAPRPPTEKDLTSFKPYKLLIQQCPGLEKQLLLAWNGDIKAREAGELEDELIFPRLLKVGHLEKYGFIVCQEHMLTVKALYERYIEKLHIANRAYSGWFSI